MLLYLSTKLRSYLHLRHYSLRVFHFHLKDSHLSNIIDRTSNDLGIQDFHLYSITDFSVFLNPNAGMIVEPSPSTKVPYDLRNTLGYLAADYLILMFLNLHKVVSSLLWYKTLKISQQLKIFIIYISIYSANSISCCN